MILPSHVVVYFGYLSAYPGEGHPHTEEDQCAPSIILRSGLYYDVNVLYMGSSKVRDRD